MKGTKSGRSARKPRIRAIALDIDSRFRSAGFVRGAMEKIFPDHWSFLLGEIALYSFAILILTGIFLTFWFKPSLGDIVYDGSYRPLAGLHMSEAYSSVLHICFDVRGGLLIRQIHHWAALVFVGTIMIHALRIFFTGAFRKPRELNWVIGTTMFALAVVEGFAGYSLPDDLLSGTGIRIAEGIMLSIPIVGTYITYFFFGGQYPGDIFISRLYIAHVLLIPGLLIALITAHLMIIWHQGHTQWPGKKQREENEVGDPFYPIFIAKTQALFIFTFGVLALLGTFAQINPIWLYGPYSPANDFAGSQPDYYIGIVEGALRITPGFVGNVDGYTFVWNTFLSAAFLPLLFLLLMAFYPFFEQWATGDLRYHNLLDRPRNMPARTAFGAAVIALGVNLLLAGGDDVISAFLKVSLYPLVWFFRIGFFVFPVIAYFVTRSACLALQRRDRHRLHTGIGTGVIEEAPAGGYREVTRPIPEEMRAMLSAKPASGLRTPIPRHIIPLPTPRRVRAQIRARLNHYYVRGRLENTTSDAVALSPERMRAVEADRGIRAGGEAWRHGRGGDSGSRPATASDLTSQEER